MILDPRLVRTLTPRSIAIIGATDDRNKVGGRPLHYLQRFGFDGAIYPVNPQRAVVQGLKAYPNVLDLPSAPDVAIVAVGQSHVDDVISACAACGVGSAVIMSSGFGETGAEGRVRQDALVSRGRQLGIRLIGPNAQGVANFARGAVLNFSTMFMEVAPGDGPVAIISQSGAASVMPYAMLRERGIGVRYVVASGNDADVSVCELALAAAADPDIRVLLLYIESLTDTAMLVEAARIANSRGAAVVALKSGRSAKGAKAAASHTGAMINDDLVIDAFFKAHGIWRARDVHGLVNATELYLSAPAKASGRLVVMSHSGAVGVLCADAADDVGQPLADLSRHTTERLSAILPNFATAQNPLDLTAALMTDGALFAGTLNIVAADPEADMMLIGMPVAGEGYDIPAMAQEAARLMAERIIPVALSAPQAAVREVFRARGVPVFAHETDAVVALHQVSAHALLRDQALARQQMSVALAAASILPSSAGRFLDEAQSLDLLATTGIATVPYRHCRTMDDAHAAWHALGPTVVVKACSALVPHKSEHGLVFLRIETIEKVEEAFAACRDGIVAMGLPFEGVVVAQQVRGRHEFALGVRQDPAFGTLVMISDGGKYIEALRDFVLLLHPFSEADVLAAMRSLRIAPVLVGVRGEPPVDLGFVARTAVALGKFAASHSEMIESIDINPLIVAAKGEGGCAVDAVIERKERTHVQ